MGLFTENKTSRQIWDSTRAEQRGKCFSIADINGLRAAKAQLGDAIQVHDANFAFLTTTLAKLHKDVYEPITNYTYAEDVEMDNGGGFVDYIEYYITDWAAIANEMRNLFGNNGNLIPRVNANLDQKRVAVHTFEIAYDLRFVDLEKMKQIQLQKSIQQIYEDSIMAGWNFFVENIAYLGTKGGTGLFNSPDVLVNMIDNSTATGKGFQGCADDVIVSWFNGVFAVYLKNSNMNPNILPDTFLVPSFVGSDLSGRFSTLYTSNLRKFIKEFNMGVDETDGKLKVDIRTRGRLDDLGTGAHGRIVAYRKNKKFVRLDVPYTLQHYITLPNIERMSYTSSFVGQVSDLQMPYNRKGEFGIVSYWDFTK